MTPFGKAVLTAEQLTFQDRAAEALDFYRRALDLADSDFKRSYVQGEWSYALQWLGCFDEALVVLQDGLRTAERSGWQEYVDKYQAQLARLYCHLGRFSESEPYFKRYLQSLKERGEEEAWIRESQNLGMAFLEQGRYAAALEVFTRVSQYFENKGSDPEKALARMQLAWVYSFLGMSSEGQAQIASVEAILSQEALAPLRAHWNLLNGRFEMIQGQLSQAFQCFEAAAEGFEGAQDLNGKVEVMLSLSGPLLELNLLREARQLIEQMAGWEELRQYPALEHSVRLRRLALSAFSGRTVQQDLELIKKENAGVGRAEDWLLFWMHMSLAARNLAQYDLMKDFLRQARRVADKVYAGLNEPQRQSFLRRPDIARLWRLTEAVPVQKVRPRRDLASEGPADAGIFAPPKREK